MRIITDSDGRVLDVSFGALISCGGQDCQEYTGSVPADYTSLEDWYLQEADKLYRWTVVDGELTLDSSAETPTDKLPAADYVVEQGTSGIWTYRKWNSGIAECWGREQGLTLSDGWCRGTALPLRPIAWNGYGIAQITRWYGTDDGRNASATMITCGGLYEDGCL